MDMGIFKAKANAKAKAIAKTKILLFSISKMDGPMLLHLSLLLPKPFTNR